MNAYSKKILPLGNNALIKYDLILYVEMEALLSNEKLFESSKAWYMTNYTQLYCVRSDKHIPNNRYSYKNVHISQPKNPFIKEKITSNCFYKPSKILNFIIKQISQDNYIKILLDHFFLPNYKFYNSKHVFHTEFIYGYDLDKNVLYVVGSNNLRMGGFARTEIRIEDFLKSYISTKSEHPFKTITILQIKEDKEYSFDIKKLQKGLSSYYSSKLYVLDKLLAFNDKHSFFKVYGLKTYSELSKILKNEFYVLNQTSLNSIKYLQALADYKKLMLQRIEYLYKNHFLARDEYEFLYNRYVEIVKGFDIVINLYIKNYLTSKSDTSKIINRLAELENIEKEIIENLILKLAKYKKK